MANNYSPIMPNFGSAQNTTNPNLGSNTAKLLMGMQKSREEEAYKSQILDIRREELAGANDQRQWLRGADGRQLAMDQKTYEQGLLNKQNESINNQESIDAVLKSQMALNSDYIMPEADLATIQKSAQWGNSDNLARGKMINGVIQNNLNTVKNIPDAGYLRELLTQSLLDDGNFKDMKSVTDRVDSIMSGNGYSSISENAAQTAINGSKQSIMNIPKGGGNNSYSGYGGSSGGKRQSDSTSITSFMKQDQEIQAWLSNNTESGDRSGFAKFFNMNEEDVYNKDVKNVISQLTLNSKEFNGVQPIFALAAAKSVIDDKESSINFSNMSEPDMTKMRLMARELQANALSSGGDSLAYQNTVNQVVNYNDKVNKFNIDNTNNRLAQTKESRKSKYIGGDDLLKLYPSAKTTAEVSDKEGTVAELFPATKSKAATSTGNILSTGLSPEAEIEDQIDRMEKYNTFEEYLDQEKPRTNIKTDDLRKLFARMESSYESTATTPAPKTDKLLEKTPYKQPTAVGGYVDNVGKAAKATGAFLKDNGGSIFNNVKDFYDYSAKKPVDYKAKAASAVKRGSDYRSILSNPVSDAEIKKLVNNPIFFKDRDKYTSQEEARELTQIEKALSSDDPYKFSGKLVRELKAAKIKILNNINKKQKEKEESVISKRESDVNRKNTLSNKRRKDTFDASSKLLSDNFANKGTENMSTIDRKEYLKLKKQLASKSGNKLVLRKKISAILERNK